MKTVDLYLRWMQILSKMLTNWIQEHITVLIHCDQLKLLPEMQKWLGLIQNSKRDQIPHRTKGLPLKLEQQRKNKQKKIVATVTTLV